MHIVAQVTTFTPQHTRSLSGIMALSARLYPQHKFTVLINKQQQAEPISNLQLQVYKPLLGKLSAHVSLAPLLKKLKASVFITEVNSFAPSMDIPQFGFSPIYQTTTLVHAGRSKPTIGFFSTTEQPSEAFYSLPYPIDPLEVQPGSTIEKESIDTAYFALLINNGVDAIPYLKAFSIFKKWQRSSLQLLILSNNAITEKDIPNFNTYKYRQDVKVRSYTDHALLNQYVSDAFAVMVQYNLEQSVDIAMHCLNIGKPLIINLTFLTEKLLQGRALLTTGEPEDIADHLMYAYIQEDIMQALATHNAGITAAYNPSFTINAFIHLLEKAAASSTT